MTGAVTVASTLILVIAAGMILVRIIRGPSVLDRVVALDVLVAVLVVALGWEATVSRNAVALPILVGLSLTGFVGSAAAARYIARRDAAEPADLPPRSGTASAPSRDRNR